MTKVAKLWPTISNLNKSFDEKPNKNLNNMPLKPQDNMNKSTTLSKPFLLLAGISGTGKTRFVRSQSECSIDVDANTMYSCSNYCLVPVRPDWHEPSDLLGYISRINGTVYIATSFLKFLVQAWCEAIEQISDDGMCRLKDADAMTPFWLCLDEMNLAPVEQYFADYLSILETRCWENGKYSCDPILKKDVFDSLVVKGDDSPLKALEEELFKDAVTDDTKNAAIWAYFLDNGISLPPNLIVAGTVNMDETTHGFSRKVIDRALTIDFGEFFPNDFDDFREQKNKSKTLCFSTATSAQNIMDDADRTEREKYHTKSTSFLKSLNTILEETPFQLAYRALNELHLAVDCSRPDSPEALQAVWDDFLMQKVLPRIEGDTAKLKYTGELELAGLADVLPEKEFSKNSILYAVYHVLKQTDCLGTIWPEKGSEKKGKRPDLLRYREGQDEPIMIPCRSEKKLRWMMKRLKANHFTDFWA